MEWDYYGRKGRDGQKKKIDKANKKRKKVKVKRAKDEEVNGEGGKKGEGECPGPMRGRLVPGQVGRRIDRLLDR